MNRIKKNSIQTVFAKTTFCICQGVLLCLSGAGVLSSCDDLKDRTVADGDGNEINISETGTAEMYILSEGLFHLNNSLLARYSFARSQWTPNWFYQIAQRDLGDTANDMEAYGSKLYVVVNVSGTMEVIDLAKGKVSRQIELKDENGISRQPRAVAFHKNKAYVCSFDGTVARIDTASLQIDGLIHVGRNPEDLCVQDNKLYVSNSGALDWEGIGVDRTVSVVDLNDFRETKKIEVGPNPGKILPGPEHSVFVVTYGEQIEKGDYHFVCIDTQLDAVKKRYDERVNDFAVNDRLAYLYTFDYKTEKSEVKVFDLIAGTVLRSSFITDGTQIQKPYSIYVNPNSGNVYLTEAYNYQVMGDVLCFNPQGKLLYRLKGVGINPNTLVFREREGAAIEDSPTPKPEVAQTVYADTVFEYRPAPSQYANTSVTASASGYGAAQVLAEANRLIKKPKQCILSLGAWGGSITLGFSKAVRNVPGEYDLRITGNAYYDMYGTMQNRPGGNSEPGIVLVAQDANGNGIPDDPWYELAGSEYHNPATIRDYRITYYRPADGADVRWTDNQGNEGYVKRNLYHTQPSYYPEWEGEEMTICGVRLPDNAVNEPREHMPEHWVGYAYDFGYADNHPNNTDGCKFNLDWAVDAQGEPVTLDSIHFVRIYTAVNQNCGWTGEISTEIQFVENLHPADQVTEKK